MLKKVSRLRRNNIIKISRLRKIAEWTQINPTDPETIQHLTDAMTYGYPVQIDYEGSGWRNIQPYGWNTSKEGNILLMCYKDTGEVRSYRMDKIQDIFIDMDSMGPATNNNPAMNYDNDLDALVDNLNNGDNNATFSVEDNYPDDMPLLPEMNQQEQIIDDGAYDEELTMLENDNYIFDTQTYNEIDIENVDNNIEINNVDNNIEINNEQTENMEGENLNDEDQI